ncbi:universal stress protein [Noviherbaspirillum malthae]|uniref:universal stress protein n=1 Tax=Noviherbaspirillum malthae TaxID=1260987 RepID=UPI00188E6C6D|nr:universal stress protein [Noviherbaspirillum malthae]
MFSNILVPTDGSPASDAAIAAAMQFARRFNAHIYGLFVAPEMQYPIYLDTTPPVYLSQEEYQSSMRTTGNTYLNEMQKAAQKLDLEFSGEVVISDKTALTIVDAAERQHCDLIFIGSHGKGGEQDHLLGSVTSKVLSASSLPVLVYRATKPLDHNP